MELFEQWETVLPQYPKWCFGGSDIELDEYPDDDGNPYLALQMCGVGFNELEQYKKLLRQNGFTNLSETQLCKHIGGKVYNFNFDDPFSAGAGNLCVMFTTSNS
jgi:hypothetical protein